MRMTGRLEARQTQQLAMTPQLQQAIKLLQLSNLELQEYVEERLLENPFLERGEAPEGEGATASADDKASDRAAESGPADGSDEPVLERRERIKENAGGAPTGDEDYDAAQHVSVEKSLRELLEEQLDLAVRDPMEAGIGRYLIDLIDEAGYLTATTTDIAEKLGCQETEVAAVLATIQGFEPTGVGARTLCECLTLQLEEEGALGEPMRLFLQNLALLGSHKIAELKKLTGMDDDDLREAVTAIKKLNPKPGLAYGADTVQVVVPDVYVSERADGSWRIELNSHTLPRVIANEDYYVELSGRKQSEDSKKFLQEQINDANWLVRSLDQRARTILKVASEIVSYQDGFFAEGVRHLRPLNLKTVADNIGMHESTVSRVTTGKYLHTPRGVLELKYFFTPGIPSADGETVYSAESVRHELQKLIDQEEPLSPLSDDQLVARLSNQGIAIARRTVAKYRASLGVPSSVERKRAAKRGI
ncbi:RNA polymerase factor sigma-54 [Parvularcula maris]|uniref:RNA polymerase sigma-54 factor n=1 Tax=Parvularcula maris TaxID=2965077 RepID=A0A9X2LAC5_9PROT|nr:RNA polymerase factor sigma-54 [Parvularcula maris]MCQ8185829.1 RNA polymerase factor sigma-54 [Parvularcula maris]